MEKKKQNVILSLALAVVFLITVGLSYAYFSAKLYGIESASTIALKGGKMTIDYEEGANIVLSGIYPKEEAWASKNFTLTANNNTSENMKYKVGIDIEENTFSEGALSYSIENTLNEGGTVLENIENVPIIKTSGTQYIGYGYFTSSTNTKHIYTLNIYFKPTGIDQNEDQKAKFKGKIVVEDCLDSELITVTFNADGGTLANTTKTVLVNGVYGELPTPTKSGYYFLGWNGKNYYNVNDTIVVTPGFTLDNNDWTTLNTHANNGAGYDAGYYDYFTNNLDIEENTNYTIVAEIKEVTNGDGNLFITSQDGISTQFNTNLISPILSGIYIFNSKSKSNVTINRGLRTFFFFFLDHNNNYYIDNIFTFRISVLDYDLSLTTEIFKYEPYYITKNLNIVQNQNHTLKAIWIKNDIAINQNINDYQEVEYIESTGTQYIDTGFIPNQDTSIELSLYTSQLGAQDFLGTSSSSGGYVYGLYDGYSSTWDNYNDDIPIYNGHISGTLLISKAKEKTTITGDYNTNYTHGNTSFIAAHSLYLFARWTSSSGAYRPASMKCYSFKIWDNNTLVRNFIPVYRKSDGEVGLYDTVNNEFYRNIGTGVFIAGPDVVS